jgi:hypothetical protein
LFYFAAEGVKEIRRPTVSRIVAPGIAGLVDRGHGDRKVRESPARSSRTIDYRALGDESRTPSPDEAVSKRNSIPAVRSVRSTLSMVVESEPDSPRSNLITALTEMSARSANSCWDHPSKPLAARTCFPEIIARGERARRNISTSSLFLYYSRNIFLYSGYPAPSDRPRIRIRLRAIVLLGAVMVR